MFDAFKTMQVGELKIRKSPAAAALEISGLHVFPSRRQAPDQDIRSTR